MKKTILLLFVLYPCYSVFAQRVSDDKIEITALIQTYSESVINKDSVTFYSLFNNGPVIWCGVEIDSSGYFFSTYKGFMRAVFRLHSAEDKFDNIRITTDGSVASVMMDYSFWANDQMSNWGCKYLSLLKEHGKWKIISVAYSIEPTQYQPPLKTRLANDDH